MARLNDNIRKYLRSYVEENSHSSAIMLTGPWGCGKTYFVKDFIDEFYKIEKRTGDTDAETIKNKKLMYVSLNGVSSKNEIDRKLLISYLFSENKAKYSDFVSHLIQGYLEFQQVPVKALKQISKSLAKLTFDELSKIGKNRVIFFDDLERCKMNPQEIMGYINDFIEHSGSGIIIVCDDSKLEKEYKKIKEKCVSREFEVVTDIGFAFNSFIKIDPSSYDKFMEDEKDQVLEIFEKCKHKNLRTLKNVIFDFRKFCDEIMKIKEKGVEAIPENKRKMLISTYLKFSFGIFSNVICKEDITQQAIEDAMAFHINIYLEKQKKGEGEKDEEQGSVQSRYLNDLYYLNNGDHLLSCELWNDWFSKGAFYKETIDSFNASSSILFEKEKDEPAWYKLWHWYNLKDEEIEIIYREVLNDLENGRYLFVPHILHTAGTLLSISKYKFIKESVSEIKATILQYIDDNSDQFEYLLPDIFKNENDAWGGLGYSSKESDEFKEIKELLYEKLLNLAQRRSRELMPDLLNLMVANPEDFNRSLLDYGEAGLARVPVFNKSDSKDVFQKILELKNEHKRRVFHAIEERIKINENKPEFAEERAFYRNLLNVVESYIAENEGRLSAYVLGEIIKNNIKNSNDIE